MFGLKKTYFERIEETAKRDMEQRKKTKKEFEELQRRIDDGFKYLKEKGYDNVSSLNSIFFEEFYKPLGYFPKKIDQVKKEDKWLWKLIMDAFRKHFQGIQNENT